MNDAQTYAINVRRDLIVAVGLMQLWRLCAKPICRRSRACRGDPRRCGEGLVDWAEALSRRDKRVSFEEAMQRLREQSP